jgi:hypothetical protein
MRCGSSALFIILDDVGSSIQGQNETSISLLAPTAIPVDPLNTHGLPSFKIFLTTPALTRGLPTTHKSALLPPFSHIRRKTGDKHFLQLANTSNGRGAGVSPGPDVPTLFTYRSSHQFTFGRQSQFHNINLVTFSMDAKKANLVPQMKQAPDYICSGHNKNPGASGIKIRSA